MCDLMMTAERTIERSNVSMANECVFIYRTYHIMSHGGFRILLSEIERQLVKAPLAAAISPF